MLNYIIEYYVILYYIILFKRLDLNSCVELPIPNPLIDNDHQKNDLNQIKLK